MLAPSALVHGPVAVAFELLAHAAVRDVRVRLRIATAKILRLLALGRSV